MGGIEVIDPRYRLVLERARAVLGADERVASVAVGGSVGDGTADRWSDLDLQVVAHADRYDDFLAGWPQWLAEITPTVFARTPLAPFVINAVTDDGLTLDLSVFPGEVIDFPPAEGYAVGMLSGTRFADLDGALEYAVAEQLRGMTGPFISLVQRGEHLRHLTGVPHLLGPAHHRLPRRARRPASGQALEPHLHRRAARRRGRPPPGGRHAGGTDRLRPRRRRTAPDPGPPTLRRPRPGVAGWARPGGRRPHPHRARYRDRCLAALT